MDWDWLDMVRRSLTEPSGKLKSGVSVAEYLRWVRWGNTGHLEAVYKDYKPTISDGAWHKRILQLARFNSNPDN